MLDPQQSDALFKVTPADTFGHDLIERRIDAIERLLPGYLRTELPQVSLKGEVSTTGIGSSRVHAQYLAELLKEVPNVSCSFRDLALEKSECRYPGTLVLFSQGLSANSNAAVEKLLTDGRGVLFTAATVEGAEAAGKTRVAASLERLQAAGIAVVPMPIENEYQVLVRTIGPWFGYLAAYRVASSQADSPHPPVTEAQLSLLFKQSADQAKEILSMTSRDELRRVGAYLVASPPESSYLDNLAIKLHEGAFLVEPQVKTAVEFDHGPFQVVARNGGRVFMFLGDGAKERDVADSLDTALRAQPDGQPLIKISSELPRPLRILQYEMVMNHVMLGLMRQGGSACDQLRFSEGPNYNRVT